MKAPVGKGKKAKARLEAIAKAKGQGRSAEDVKAEPADKAKAKSKAPKAVKGARRRLLPKTSPNPRKGREGLIAAQLDGYPSSKYRQNRQVRRPEKRLLFLLGALVVFRIGAHIPVPGIDPNVLADLFKSQQGGILGMFNMFSGGALSRFTIFALGIMPYISSSIIMQLMTTVSPHLEQLKKEGQSGQRKDHPVHALWHGAPRLVPGDRHFDCAGIPAGPGARAGLMFRFVTVSTLVTGTMFLMWLGEQITERGLGNGISIIIFAGIAAGLPNAVGGTLELVRTGAMHPLTALLIATAVVLVTWAVCFVERGQRKILVNYAKRQVGNKIYGGQASHLPFKLNMAGVIPPIFRLEHHPVSGDAGRLVRSERGHELAARYLRHALARPADLRHAVRQGDRFFLLSFTPRLQYNPKDTADNLKKKRRLRARHPARRPDRALS